jgi:tungstate transport system substrate-binding protein
MCVPKSSKPRPRSIATLIGMVLASVVSMPTAAQEAVAKKPVVVRVAVIGGMMDTEFWPGIADRFERATGHRVEVVASGPKHVIAGVFARGDVDLITMHASDTIINLVADGYAADPQPWARNDLLLVGPKSDPAGIRGQKDVVGALRRIINSKATILVHASNGANEVLSDLLAAGELELDPEHTIALPSDRHRQMLQRAAKEGAYALVGRIPFLNGKVDTGGLEIMVQGDVRLRRPYLVAVATGKPDDSRLAAARQLAAFLRDAETQKWIAEYGRGKYDDRPLFFPVVVP